MKLRFFNTYVPMNTLYEDLVPALVSDGHDVELIISAAEYRPGRDAAARLSTLPGVRITKVPSAGVQPKDGRRKAFVHACYAIGVCARTLVSKRVDLNVFLTQPPFLAAFWAPVLSKLRGQAYCCVVLDVYPAALVVRTRLSESSPPIRMLNRRVVRTLQDAAQVITVARCMRDRLHEMGVRRDIAVAPYWCADEDWEPSTETVHRYRADLGWTGKLVVYYGGNVGGAFRFDDLVRAAARLGDHEDVHFVIMGSGSGLREVREHAARDQAHNLDFLPLMHDRYPLPVVLRGADVHFMGVRDEHLGIGVPAKAYAAMAAGRPILYQGHPSSEVARLIREHRIGLSVTTGDVIGLVDAILALRSDQLRSRLGRAALRLSQTRHNSTVGVDAYRHLLMSPALPTPWVRPLRETGDST